MDTAVNWRANPILAAALRCSGGERIRDDLRMVELRRGAMLHDQGEAIRQVYFPHVGTAISVGALSEKGELVLAALIGGQGVVGGGSALTGLPECSRALVLIGGQASAIQIDRLRQWIEILPELGRLIARYERFLFAQSLRTVACNGNHKIAQRLCRALLMLRDTSGLSVLPVTQDALAELLAVRRTSITLCAHALHQAGFIRTHRGEIRILNVAALKNQACDCYIPIEAHAAADTSNAIPFETVDLPARQCRRQ